MNVLTQKIKDASVKTIAMLISFTILAIVAVVYLDYILGFIGIVFDVLSPFIYGIVLAFIFQLPTGFIEKHLMIENDKKRKLISSILSIILVFLVIIILLVIVLPQVIENITVLVNNVPLMIEQSKVYLKIILDNLSLSEDMVASIEGFQNDFWTGIVSSVSKYAPSLMTGVKALTSSVKNIFLGIVIAFYITIDKERLLRQCNQVGYALLKEKDYLFFKGVMNLISRTFRQFFTGQLTESVIIGILCYIGCKILDIPYASIAAIVIGITNIIPYFGPFIGTAVSAILILFVSPIKAIVFIIFGVILQQCESNLIYPHVVGSSVGLSGLWVLFSITIGGGLFGVVGMVFGLPVFSVIYELFRRYVKERIALKQKQE
ncbi:MAG: AI-2E family transporter [Bacilli bacterium]|nr:AI-2E family transporter [Bacilli bacterium]